MRTESPDVFMYWPHADRPLDLNEVMWAVVHDGSIQESGSGQSTLMAQLIKTAAPSTDTNKTNNTNGKTAQHATCPNPARVTLIVPAEATLGTTVNVPSSKPQHIRAAVPHLIEEWSAAELDTLHIALGTRASDGTVPVAVIDRERVAQWLTAIDATDMRCEQVWVDALLLPHTPGTLTLFIDKHRALLRWATHHSGAVDIAALEPVLAAILKRGEVQRIAWSASHAVSGDILESVQTALTALRHHTLIALEQLPTIDSVWVALLNHQHNHSTQPLNLRQGDFVIPDQYQLAWQRWRPTALAACVVVVALLLLNILGGTLLNHRAVVAHAQNEALYRELFPQDKRLVNVAQQFRGHLSSTAAGGHAPFLQLFGQLANVIKTNPVDPPLQIRSLMFDTGNGALQVELIAPTIQVLDTVQKQLGAQHMRTKVLSAINEDGKLVGRLSVTGGE